MMPVQPLSRATDRRQLAPLAVGGPRHRSPPLIVEYGRASSRFSRGSTSTSRAWERDGDSASRSIGSSSPSQRASSRDSGPKIQEREAQLSRIGGQLRVPLPAPPDVRPTARSARAADGRLKRRLGFVLGTAAVTCGRPRAHRSSAHVATKRDEEDDFRHDLKSEPPREMRPCASVQRSSSCS